MKPIEIKGVITPILTPMHEDETINTEVLRQLVDRVIDNGCHGIFACGTMGEGYILSGTEKKLIFETVVDQCRGRIPVFAGTGCISTKETISQSLMAKEVGVDALSLITPSFASASQEELYQHYKAVAEAVDLPIILYNIPARTGNALAPETVARLAQIENIVGVKDTSGSFSNILDYINAGKTKTNGNFSVLSGDNRLIIWTLLAGGAGGISGSSNVYPHTMASIYDLFVEGKVEEARKTNESIQSYLDCLKTGNATTLSKMAVSLLGYEVGKARAPFNLVPEEKVQELKKVLTENKEKGIK